MSTTTSEPAAVEKSITVRLDAAAAFTLFTRDMRRWWPVATYSLLEGADVALHFGAAVGETVAEIDRDGGAHVWGTIAEWDPPRAFAMSWHPGRPAEEATRLRVRFSAVAGGTRIELRHDRWSARPDGSTARETYDRGWHAPLAAYADAASRGAA